ncbi:MAG: Regulatory protein recX [Pseudonocardia sp.]|nr:Regulatory protein recX [Pseudonocardia sp.]
MTQLPPDGDAEGDKAHPDRPTPPGPVRVARFDMLRTTADEGADGAGARRVARFERLDTGGGVGGDTAQSPGARVVGFDELRSARRRREAGETPRRATDRRARRSGSGATERRAAGLASAPDIDGAVTEAASLPPDGRLPRGRRRRAAGRAGRGTPVANGSPVDRAPEPPADPVVVAREICLRLLTDRARTRQELADALARKGVPAEAAAAVLDRFDEVRLIDDAAFAGQWVRSRHRHRGLGRRAIANELRRKGVADEVAGEALAEIDTESEDRRARELVDRKLRSLTIATTDQRTAAARRLVGMLARKGYSAGTAYRVVREALAERGAEVDEWHEADPTDE